MRDFKASDYLAGFVDGEGCFLIYRQQQGPEPCFSFQLVVTQRADSAEVLRQLQATFGGSLHHDQRKAEIAAGMSNANPRVIWSVTAREDVMSLVVYFDEHELIVKATEYAAFRQAAMTYYEHTPGRGRLPIPKWLAEKMDAARSELKRLKRYEADMNGGARNVSQPRQLTFDSTSE